MFQGVTFTLWWALECSIDGGVLNGTVTEPKGVTFYFVLPDLPGPSEYNTWISPDKFCGVEWNRALTAILLVET